MRIDEDRNGTLDRSEFQRAIKQLLHINVSEAQADELISRINAQSGVPLRSHVAFAPFCAAFSTRHDFKQASHDGHGDDKQPPDKSMSAAKVPHATAWSM